MGTGKKTTYEELDLDVVVFEGTDVICSSQSETNELPMEQESH